MRMPKIRSGTILLAGLACLTGAMYGEAAETPAAALPPEFAPGSAPGQIAELHSLAESLWNEYAPEAVKAEYELIGRDELLAFFTRLETAGGQEDLERFAAYAPEARAALEALRSWPDFADYADWLREQLDYMDAAEEAAKTPAIVPPPPPLAPPPAKPERPARPKAKSSGIPLYELWLARVEKRARPTRADEFLPVLTAAFAAEGVPRELAWLAEVESTFNPRALSPAGAKGLFQLMPVTARALGLSLLPVDQRMNPESSARAAAAYLKKLYARFGDWPLALAAYNAGEGRVARTLKVREAKDFAGIAVYLASDASRFHTGDSFVIDGGYTIF